MKKLKKILFPTDFSRCANQALAHALDLAKKYHAELHMFHGIVLHAEDPHNPLHHIPDVAEIHKTLKDTATEQMDSIIRSYHAEDFDIVKVQDRGIAAAPVILEYAKDNDIDLIVMGTHGRRGLEHLFLGSVAEEVIRTASCPVMTVREQKEAIPVEDITDILVPVDFSEHSKIAVTHALEVAAAYKAKLQLLHVVEESVHPAFYASGKTSVFELVPNIKAKSEEALDKLMQETKGPKVEHESHVIEGRAARDIVKFAESHDSNLIVISTHGLTGIQHLLVGSVTEKVVRIAPCPVLTVKAFGKSLV